MPNKQPSLLLVDDNRSFISLLSKLLEKEGYAVNTCYSGKEARLVIGKSKFDIVVSDMYMNDGNGIELLTWLHDTHSTSKIILMSGVMDQDRLKDITLFKQKLGDFQTITKPFKVDELIALINKH